MNPTLYTTILAILYGVGFATASTYVYLYRAWRVEHWQSAYTRDVSGIVVVLWAIYGWLIFRLAAIISTGQVTVPPGINAGVAVAIFVLIDGYFFQRLVLFLRALREERRQPTRICKRCGGRGVVPVGTPRDHFDIAWDDDDDATPPPVPPPQDPRPAG